MHVQAETYKAEDDAQAKRIDAKNGLENYAYSLRNTIRDDKFASKLPADDKAKLEKAVEDALHWLEGNQLAEVEEFEHQQKQLEATANPIISRAYQGGAEGGMPGGMGGSAGRGPQVEEVD